MATLRDLKKRIKAIRNTQKITKAMKMVAAAKLRKVQDRMLNFRPYAFRIREIVSDLSMAVEREAHPILTVRPRKTIELLVITSDKGLCGAFNANILRFASQQIAELKREGFEISLSTVGKKAFDYFTRRGFNIRSSWVGLSGKVSYDSAKEIARDIIEGYINERFDEVRLTFNEFKSLISQRLVSLKILPVEGLEEGSSNEEQASTSGGSFLYEPSIETVFERLLPRYIEIQVFRALLESSAAEEAARMAAMENATKNCEDLVQRVTLRANKLRQEGITKELMDIVGGVEALRKSG
jgi:F-type H+-transporting ATPase subunit gamma